MATVSRTTKLLRGCGIRSPLFQTKTPDDVEAGVGFQAIVSAAVASVLSDSGSQGSSVTIR